MMHPAHGLRARVDAAEIARLEFANHMAAAALRRMVFAFREGMTDFAAVEVYPGKTIEWFLVPLKKGTFNVVCTIPGHAETGMKGKIEVASAPCWSTDSELGKEMVGSWASA